MADKNDYKIVASYSINFFNVLQKELELASDFSEVQKARLGFYHLILEAITGESDIRKNTEFITDQEYNQLVFKNRFDDLGMDAVYIKDGDEEEEGNIYLFNFKYREEFNPEQSQEETALSRCEKFLTYTLPGSEKIRESNKVSTFVEKIKECLSSTKIWNVKLFLVSNENKPLNNRDIIKRTEQKYGIKIKCLTLNDIIKFIGQKKEDNECKFLVDQNDYIMFNRDSGSTEMSYVIKLNLIDLIRMTSTDEEMPCRYNIENDDEIKDLNFNHSLLFDNVRGYLGDTSYNKAIRNTLTNVPENFFVYNNGLTFITSSLEAGRKNGGTKLLFDLRRYQLVNGGQTIKTIYEYLQDDRDIHRINNLRTANALVRIFKVPSDGKLKNKIAEYTNSQNSISPQDLKSVDDVQIKIENFLSGKEIQYVRKVGILPEPQKIMYRLGMDTLAKIIYASKGFPDRVTNQKKKLFTIYYEEIFGASFDIDSIIPLIAKYKEIKQRTVNITDQQTYYILYVIAKKNCEIDNAKKYLDRALSTYETPKQISDARKLIQKRFKEHLDAMLNTPC